VGIAAHSAVSLRVPASQSRPSVQRMMRAVNEHRMSTGLADRRIVSTSNSSLSTRTSPKIRIAVKLANTVRALERADDFGLRFEPDASRLGAGALDALSIAVMVVDGNMRVKHANAAAVALTNGVCGMTVSRAGPDPSPGSTTLSARHPDDHSRLSQLVAAVAKGGSGCALRMRNTRDEPASRASLAILVSPAMTHFLSGPGTGKGTGCRIQPGTAMIVARHLNHPSLPQPGLMCDLYGLTKAEAAVALSFGGGATAEDVARTRRVSPETIRSQVKAIQRKANTSNLRDLERVIAISSAMLPAPL
jgi:DNA-binding NarL/FixJ family response regulator